MCCKMFFFFHFNTFSPAHIFLPKQWLNNNIIFQRILRNISTLLLPLRMPFFHIYGLKVPIFTFQYVHVYFVFRVIIYYIWRLSITFRVALGKRTIMCNLTVFEFIFYFSNLRITVWALLNYVCWVLLSNNKTQFG